MKLSDLHENYDQDHIHEASKQLAIYFDYTGAGRRPEPIAGPFNSMQEAKDYATENEISLIGNSNYFIDVYRN